MAEKKWQTDQPWGKKRGNSHSTAGGKGERCWKPKSRVRSWALAPHGFDYRRWSDGRTREAERAEARGEKRSGIAFSFDASEPRRGRDKREGLLTVGS